MNFAKFLGTPFLENTSGRLLLDTVIHRCNILWGIFDEIITEFQLPPPFKDDLEQLKARLVSWKGHASVHLKSNREDKRKRYTGKPVRPAYDIPSEQIERLRSMGFSWVKIAGFLSVSETRELN